MRPQEGEMQKTECISPFDWARGAVGGFVGGIGFGLIMRFVMPQPMLEVIIPAMYGTEATPEDPALGHGWFFHQFHSVLLGLTYVPLVEGRIGSQFGNPRHLKGGISLGTAYGMLTTTVLAMIVLPLWLRAVDFPDPPPFPNISSDSLPGLIGHVIYGITVGVTYALFRR